MIHTNTNFIISFGNASNGISAHEYKQAYEAKGSLIPKACGEAIDLPSTNPPIFLRQIHSTNGVIISASSDKNVYAFSREGDFLITNQQRIGLGVLTADCLPIIIYDPINNVIAVVHAGWRGSVAGIAPKVIEAMKEQFSCESKHLRVFFGPAAKSCCYAVDKPVVDQLDHTMKNKNYLIWKDNQPYFDLAGFNKALLVRAGLQPSALCFYYNQCTICNPEFCSYRREKNRSGRQITMAMLT